MPLKLPDTGAPTDAQGRRHSPSAQRNAPAILAALQAYPLQGHLLEIASGSGYHAAHIAPHFPNLTWQPTDYDTANLPSITAWTHAIANIRPPIQRDATAKDWHKTHPNQDAILLINLLHLITKDQAASLLTESALSLTPGGHAFFSTINRNAKAYLYAIIGAEYLLRLLPRGTHDYAKFLKPSELAAMCRDCGLEIAGITGMTYNPVTMVYALGKDADVNYIMHCRAS